MRIICTPKGATNGWSLLGAFYVVLILLFAVAPAFAEEGDSPTPAAEPEVEAQPGWPAPEALFAGFEIRATGVGFMDGSEFIGFLDRSESDQEPNDAGILGRGWLWAALLILAGGFLLNLTPCVLPMIPINLAIIGAGAKADSRRRGFLLGGAYGLSMALVYGGLGLVVVLTGATFGTLNASPVFNAVIALLFVVLALGMFDLLPIDFSRFQRRIQAGKSRGRFALAFGMGGVAALLAGACVAPVLISVLLLSAELYGRGIVLGLGLPFLLGLGMGLPWPLAGAGLSFLPKPGRWMNAVKYLFGILILATALYYGRLAWNLSGFAAATSPPETETMEDGEAFRLSATSTHADWDRVLDLSRESGKPVLIDFWATWCRVCLVMQRTTFQEDAVVERLREVVFVKYQAETPQASPSRELLEYFEVVGLPTYIILTP